MVNISEHLKVKSKLELLLGYIQTDIEAGTDSGKSSSKKSIILKILSIIVSFFVTVILGWSFLGDYGKNAAIVLSALLTAINTWEAFGNYRERTVQERTNVNKLFKLERDIELYLAENDDCKMSDYDEYKKTFDKLHEEYTETRNTIDNKNSTSNKPDAQE